MKRRTGLLSMVLVFSAGLGVSICPGIVSGQGTTTRESPALPKPADKRERAMDRIVHIEEGILREIPQVPRLCDGMDIRKEKVNIGDGKLYCEQEGQGTPLVLLHGGPGATHHHFHPFLSQAKDFARVIYYDQRGCGLSDYQPGQGYSVDQAADDLDRLRQALGIKQWVLLGHSYGGFLAQYYATKHPGNVQGLVLLCASTGLHGESLPSRQHEFIAPEERQKMSQIRKTSGLSMAQLVYNNHLNGDWKRQSYYKPTREQLAQTALYGWVHDFDRNFNGVMSQSQNAVDLEGAFAQCPLPTLILEGKWDLTWNTDKPERFRKNHPNAKFVLFEASGHSPFEDEPEKFFPVLRDFLTTLPPVPGARVDAWKGHLAEWREDKQARQRIEQKAAKDNRPAVPDVSTPPTAGVPGANRVLSLDGKAGFVRVADSPSLHTFTNALTIEAWFKASSFAAQQGYINSLLRKNVAAESENFLLRFRTIEGEPWVEVSPGADLGVARASLPFTTGKWYHVAGVYDGTAVIIYVNGTRIGSQSISGRMSIDDSDLFLGKGDPEFSSGEYFHGVLDEIRLWNVARSQNEIQTAMNTALTGKEPGLVGYWDFDNETVKDKSGHGNDGVLGSNAQMMADVTAAPPEDRTK